MLAATLVLLGSGLTGWGVRVATGAERPIDLVGALAAPLGFAIALVGIARWAVGLPR